MKITGTSKVLQHLVDCIEARTAVRQLDVGENDPRPLDLGQRHRLFMRARDAEHPMAEAFHQAFEIERDEGLVLDDQHVGGDFGGELATGIVHQLAQLRYVDIQHLGGVVLRKPFQRDQQKGLARHRCDLGEMPFDRLLRPRRRLDLPLRAIEFQIFVNSR